MLFQIFESLEASIDQLKMFQSKFIGILSKASSAFPDNHFVGSMKSKFINMNKKANMYLIIRLCVKNESVPITDGTIQPADFDGLKLWNSVHSDMNDSKLVLF